MSGAITAVLNAIRPIGFVARQAILMGAMLVALAIGGGIVFAACGDLVSATVSAGICWLGAALALSTSYLCRTHKNTMLGVLLPTVFRTALPLAVLLTLNSWGPLKDTQALVYDMIVFYFVALVIETPLSLFDQDRSASR